jgi:hypothetical protein
LQASVVATVFGKNIMTPTLHCRYMQGLPHQRGNLNVSPLVSGSGMEFSVATGDRIILMIERAPADPNDCHVLRIELLKNEPLIKSLVGRVTQG